jgi:hypothetical protein
VARLVVAEARAVAGRLLPKNRHRLQNLTKNRHRRRHLSKRTRRTSRKNIYLVQRYSRQPLNRELQGIRMSQRQRRERQTLDLLRERCAARWRKGLSTRGQADIFEMGKEIFSTNGEQTMPLRVALSARMLIVWSDTSRAERRLARKAA